MELQRGPSLTQINVSTDTLGEVRRKLKSFSPGDLLGISVSSLVDSEVSTNELERKLEMCLKLLRSSGYTETKFALYLLDDMIQNEAELYERVFLSKLPNDMNCCLL